MSRTLRVALVCALSMALASPAPAEEVAARVAWVTGAVTVHRVGQQAPQSVTVGAALFHGDRVRAAPGADAGLMINGALRNLSALPDARWTAGEPFEPPARSFFDSVRDRVLGPAATSLPGGVEFADAARRKRLEDDLKARGLLAVIGSGKGSSGEGLGSLFDQQSGGGGSLFPTDALATAPPSAARGEAFEDPPRPAGAPAGPPRRHTRPASEAAVVLPREFRVPGARPVEAGHLTLREKGKDAVVWSGPVVRGLAKFPPGALQAGRSYAWTLDVPGRLRARTGVLRTYLERPVRPGGSRRRR